MFFVETLFYKHVAPAGLFSAACFTMSFGAGRRLLHGFPGGSSPEWRLSLP